MREVSRVSTETTTARGCDGARPTLLLWSLVVCGLLASALPHGAAAQGSEMLAQSEQSAFLPAGSPRVTSLERNMEELTRTISVMVEDAALETVLHKIVGQTGLQLSFRRELVPPDLRVSLDMKNVSVMEALCAALEGTGLQTQISWTGHLILTPAPEPRTPAPTDIPPLQLGSIAGAVVDADTGDPLPGVNVFIDGTTQGASTGADGRYEITGVTPGVYSVRASFIGYMPKVVEEVEVTPDQTTQVDFALSQDVIALDEIVAVGYGEQRRRDLTGALSSVSPEEIESQPTTNVADALQGRVSGVEITRTSGAPGSEPRIRIRGANSLRGDNDPLVVVDGFIGGDLSSLSPNDIASLDVLKGASATAIYGSRGANGVLIVETKRGQRGEPRVAFESYWSPKQVSRRPDLLSPLQYARMANERDRSVGEELTFTQEELAEIERNGGTDWQDLVFRQGLTQDYALSVNGGNEAARYYVSGNFTDDSGVIINSNYKRYGARGNVNSTVNDRLDLYVNLAASRENHHNTDDLGQYVQGLLSSALVWPPTASIYNDGDYTQELPYGPETGPFPHPLFLALEDLDDSAITTLLANGSADMDLLEGLTLTVNGSARSRAVNSNAFTRNEPGEGLAGASSSVRSRHGVSWQHSEVLTYERSFNANHRLKASAIFEQQYHSVRIHGASASDFPTLALGYSGLGIGGTQYANSGFSQWTLQSYVGRANYTLMDRYLITGTVRVDGSSRFTEGNRYGTFPSVAVAWRLSDEPFLESVEWLDNLKLRSSWGITGTQAIGPYATLPTLSINHAASFDGQSQTIGIGPSSPANSDLTWEETTQYNVGFDLDVANRRVSVAADLYEKNTKDLLLRASVPAYSGYNSILRNLGKVRNRGIELSLSAIPLQTEDWLWENTLTFSANRNEVVEVGSPDVDGEFIFGGDFLRGQGIGPTFVIEEGESMGRFYGLIYDGVWQEDEAEEAARYGSRPGDARYRDLDDNGSYDDLTVIGNSTPDFTWGLSSNMSYRNFTLNVLVHAVHGADVLYPVRSFMIGQVAAVENGTSVDVLDRWSPDNPDGRLPAFSNTSLLIPQSSLFVEDGSYIRLRNVTLSYRLPMSLLDGVARSANVFVRGKDLLTFTGYSGFDPEVNSAGGSDVNDRIDMGAYPHSRSLTFGVKATF